MNRNWIGTKKIFFVSICIWILMFLMIFSAWGYSTGVWDRAKIGCGDSECHAVTANPTVTVDITGLPAEYIPDQLYPLTITVSGGPATTNGGFNLEVSSGILSPNDFNVQVNLPSTQATHTSSNRRSWIVNWQAPTFGTGDVNFWVAGNAVDNSGDNFGDGWNLNSYTVPESDLPDTLPPEISNVMINGASSQTYPFSSIPTLTLSATINDLNTGNSDIGGANFTEEVQNWETSQSMILQNLPTSPTEVFEATIIPPTVARLYGFYVYGWDDVPNYNFTNNQQFASLTITDDVAPRISNVAVDGENGKAVLEGTVVNLTATISDSETGGRAIAGANFTIGPANWSSSIPLNSQDGIFDGPNEDVTYSLDTTGWPHGTFELYIYGWDDIPNYNISSIAHATLVITTDLDPPEISNVIINGAQTQTYSLSSIPTLALTATVDDSDSGNSDIGMVNYTIGIFEWETSQAMFLTNPPISPTEDFSVTLITPTIAGTYDFYVYAQDSIFNLNTTNSQQFATLTIIDDMAPRIKNVTLNGITNLNLIKGAQINLRAEVDDSQTGFSNIEGANYTIGEANWATGVQMNAKDSIFDDVIEVVEIPIDATAWEPGSYKIYVYGFDSAQPVNNHNISSYSYVELDIQAPPQGVVVSNAKEEGSLEIGWNAVVSNIISGFNIYRSQTQGGPYVLIGSANPTETAYFDTGLNEGETYYYVISGFDSEGNETLYSEEASATVGAEPEPEDENGVSLVLPIILLGIILVIVLLIIFWKKRYSGED